jgi:hypothetical protein
MPTWDLLPASLTESDEWKQLPGLQNAFFQGRGGEEIGGRAEKTGRGTPEAG